VGGPQEWCWQQFVEQHLIVVTKLIGCQRYIIFASFSRCITAFNSFSCLIAALLWLHVLLIAPGRQLHVGTDWFDVQAAHVSCICMAVVGGNAIRVLLLHCDATCVSVPGSTDISFEDTD